MMSFLRRNSTEATFRQHVACGIDACYIQSFYRRNTKRQKICLLAACYKLSVVACRLRRLSTRLDAVYPTVNGSMRLEEGDMEWSNDKTVAFIEDYHNSPELWNNKTPVYKDIKLRNDKLTQLSGKYDCTLMELKKKIKNLRSAFHRERKKLQEKKSGSSPSKKGKWFAYELLSFLIDVDVPKTTSSTAGSDEEEFDVDMLHSSSQLSVPSPSAYAILQNSVSQQKDASTVFGEYVATKHRKYSCYTKNVIEHLINTILYNVDMGKYDDPSATSQRSILQPLRQNLPTTTQQFEPDDHQPLDISAIHSEPSPASEMDRRVSDVASYYASFSEESYSSSNY
ncbi:uncharacterized protein LOC130892977 [Diorhabda carinulata]|uniref:uncharacterized protein LOC130892977 n=1 Tax=Diorhabda carinulata TaxID=1163345 RepID=UPI0025A159C9|nr:uncharacterized protein LOC130892977 [Diorhabda carinulata]